MLVFLSRRPHSELFRRIRLISVRPSVPRGSRSSQHNGDVPVSYPSYSSESSRVPRRRFVRYYQNLLIVTKVLVLTGLIRKGKKALRSMYCCRARRGKNGMSAACGGVDKTSRMSMVSRKPSVLVVPLRCKSPSPSECANRECRSRQDLDPLRALCSATYPDSLHPALFVIWLSCNG